MANPKRPPSREVRRLREELRQLIDRWETVIQHGAVLEGELAQGLAQLRESQAAEMLKTIPVTQAEHPDGPIRTAALEKAGIHTMGEVLACTRDDLVEIPGVGTPAEVVSVGSDDTLQLKAGILKMKAKAKEVRLIEDDERAAMKKKAPKPMRTTVTGLHTAASRELDIRGMETLEAESVVETFLSSAVMGHLETVTIIHGKGTGALRKAVHDILRRNKNVKSFRLGVYGEGENGVTVVTLK